MAQAACGQHFSWDCPMWCTGKKTQNMNYVNVQVDPMCISCPWYEGNNKKIEDYE